MPVESRAVRRARGRRSLGLDAEAFAVGIVARLHPGKGQDVVVRAAASLLHARPAARLLVVGSAMFGITDDYTQRLQQLARDLAIADRVTFTGFRDDVGDCLAALDIAIQASTGPEAFGLALVEAMAAGTAIVAARGGAAGEIVTDGADGLLVPPGDHEALALALLALHDDPERRAALAEAGTLTAQDRFDVNDMVRQVEDLYAELLPR
jgi:glycosyltransferase involved in cell wall biosynthesis